MIKQGEAVVLLDYDDKLVELKDSQGKIFKIAKDIFLSNFVDTAYDDASLIKGAEFYSLNDIYVQQDSENALNKVQDIQMLEELPAADSFIALGGQSDTWKGQNLIDNIHFGEIPDWLADFDETKVIEGQVVPSDEMKKKIDLSPQFVMADSLDTEERTILDDFKDYLKKIKKKESKLVLADRAEEVDMVVEKVLDFLKSVGEESISPLVVSEMIRKTIDYLYPHRRDDTEFFVKVYEMLDNSGIIVQAKKVLKDTESVNIEKNSEGKWILHFTADDVIEFDTKEELMDFLGENNKDVFSLNSEIRQLFDTVPDEYKTKEEKEQEMNLNAVSLYTPSEEARKDLLYDRSQVLSDSAVILKQALDNVADVVYPERITHTGIRTTKVAEDGHLQDGVVKWTVTLVGIPIKKKATVDIDVTIKDGVLRHPTYFKDAAGRMHSLNSVELVKFLRLWDYPSYVDFFRK